MLSAGTGAVECLEFRVLRTRQRDRKSTRLNSSHRCISYAVFCLKKKNDELADLLSQLVRAAQQELLEDHAGLRSVENRRCAIRATARRLASAVTAAHARRLDVLL